MNLSLLENNLLSSDDCSQNEATDCRVDWKDLVGINDWQRKTSPAFSTKKCFDIWRKKITKEHLNTLTFKLCWPWSWSHDCSQNEVADCRVDWEDLAGINAWQRRTYLPHFYCILNIKMSQHLKKKLLKNIYIPWLLGEIYQKYKICHG